MKPLHIKTPLFESMSMNQLTGKKILLKMDCYQPSGSFKIRGIGRLCQEYFIEGKQHLVSSSGGNAGHAVAYSARKLGIKATVFVPSATHDVFRQRILSEGAELIVAGDVWDDADKAAREFVAKSDAGYVPPFNHPTIWGGHETMADELVEQCDEKPDAIVVSVGGGGLLCGLLDGLYKYGWKDIPIIGVETEGAADLKKCIETGKHVALNKINTIATTLGTKVIAEHTFEWINKHEIIPVAVSDKSTIEACRLFIDGHHTLVEPACGAALSVVYQQVPELEPFNRIVVIVCGGVGISYDLLNDYIAKLGATI